MSFTSQPGGCQLKILLFKLAQLASFDNKNYFELSTQKRGQLG